MYAVEPGRRAVRILHAPADVGGHAWGLSRAERELGLESDVAVFSPGPFGYRADIDLRAGSDQPVWRRLGRRAGFVRHAIRKYDVFHFNFGLTLLTVRQFGHVFDELALLKRLGKTVLVTYQGCDVRPKASCPCRQQHCFEEDRYRLPAARRVLRRADRVFYLNPDLRRQLPGASFLPYANIDARCIEPMAEPQADELAVVHAPTREDVKGTRHVVAAVETLQGEGLPLTLDVVQGVTREEVLARCARGHIVVDQLLIGWYGGFAVEAMAMQRPVLAYIRDDETDDNPFGSDLPIVRTTPEGLVDDLRLLATDSERRRVVGLAGRRFVEQNHDPRRIAKRTLEGLAAFSPPAGMPGDGPRG